MSLVTLRTLPGMKIECTHNESGATFMAATPKMYNGSGDSFSGTDLCATSLGVCATTIMSVYARDNGMDICGMTVELDKEMNASPRSIGGVRLVFNMPDRGYDAMQKQALEESIRTCPICLTLKGVVQDISFRW
ncbi:OsmC family protein [Desulfovibrio sp. OttesenSCG-928-C06]|nr:OsmC family protein [Desulfovibrio sp. OttesenSCG-928-C06]